MPGQPLLAQLESAGSLLVDAEQAQSLRDGLCCDPPMVTERGCRFGAERIEQPAEHHQARFVSAGEFAHRPGEWRV